MYNIFKPWEAALQSANATVATRVRQNFAAVNATLLPYVTVSNTTARDLVYTPYSQVQQAFGVGVRASRINGTATAPA